MLKTLDFTEKFYFRCFLGGRGNMKGFVRGISTKILLKEIDLSQVLFFLSSGESSTTETRLSPSASPHQDRVLERIGCSCFEATANKNKMQNFDWIFFWSSRLTGSTLMGSLCGRPDCELDAKTSETTLMERAGRNARRVEIKAARLFARFLSKFRQPPSCGIPESLHLLRSRRASGRNRFLISDVTSPPRLLLYWRAPFVLFSHTSSLVSDRSSASSPVFFRLIE